MKHASLGDIINIARRTADIIDDPDKYNATIFAIAIAIAGM